MLCTLVLHAPEVLPNNQQTCMVGCKTCSSHSLPCSCPESPCHPSPPSPSSPAAPAREEQLIAFLKQLEQDQERLGVTDVQLSLTSLEEVFLTIARKVGPWPALAQLGHALAQLGMHW